MSRHRHFRNLRYEDYLDDDQQDDAYDDYDYDQDPQTAHTANPPENADGDPILDDLVHQFRLQLNDDTLPTAEVDAAIIAADYDVDAAIQLLREQRAALEAVAEAQAARLEMQQPSAIGRLLDEGSNSGHVFVEIAAEQQPRYEQLESVEGGPALDRGKLADRVERRFHFDLPSPDDVIIAKQGKAGMRAQAIRLPKASALSTGKAGVSVEEKKVELKGKKPLAKAGVQPRSARTKREMRGDAKNSVTKEKVTAQRVKVVDLTKRKKAGCRSLSVVVAGHVDAGKSTLLNHFLSLIEDDGGSATKRRKKPLDLAWGTDEDGVERERGVTIDIATRIFNPRGPNAKTYAMIDAPGHRDFVPAMILGAAQASAALLIVDASPGEFEAGFSEDGQTREHALVLKSLSIGRMIVIVNKMDVVEYSQERYELVKKTMSDFLGSNGWKIAQNVSFLPASGRQGVNLVRLPDSSHPLMEWYRGKCVLDEIEGLPTTNPSVIEQASSKATRLVVSDYFRSTSLGGAGAVTGRLLHGSIAPKDKLLLCPGGTTVTVKNVEIASGERVPVAIAGIDSIPVSISLQELPDGVMIAAGAVLCAPESPVPIAICFRAQLVMAAAKSVLIQGTQGVLHIGGGSEAACISRLCEYVQGKKAVEKKRFARRLVKGDTAIVEMTCKRGVAMERGADTKALGRFAFRQEGKTVGVGVVTEILKTAKSEDDAESNEGVG